MQGKIPSLLSFPDILGYSFFTHHVLVLLDSFLCFPLYAHFFFKESNPELRLELSDTAPPWQAQDPGLIPSTYPLLKKEKERKKSRYVLGPSQNPFSYKIQIRENVNIVKILSCDENTAFPWSLCKCHVLPCAKSLMWPVWKHHLPLPCLPLSIFSFP